MPPIVLNFICWPIRFVNNSTIIKLLNYYNKHQIKIVIKLSSPKLRFKVSNLFYNMGYQKKLSFERTVMLKHRDNLVSSDYNDVHPFIPSYDTRCEKPNVFYLLSNEYQRIWEREKNEYFKSTITIGTVPLKPWLRGHARKHQHNIPRLTIPYCEPGKMNKKYDHIKPVYHIINHYRRGPCADRKPQATVPKCLWFGHQRLFSWLHRTII